jgi:hypothetical protein
MFCPSCAYQNPDGAAICAACGTSLPTGAPAFAAPGGYGGYAPPLAQRRTSGMAIAGFVLSFFCGVLGLIFSIIGYNECKRSLGRIEGHGLALAGIIISIVSLAFVVFYLIFVAAVIGSHRF